MPISQPTPLSILHQTNNSNNHINRNVSSSDIGNISINSMYSHVSSDNAHKQSQSGNNYVEPLTQERLNETWRRYMRSISSSDEQLYYVMDREVSFQKNDIIINLENAHQANLLSNANDLKRFLRNELRNIFIEIVPSLPQNSDDNTSTMFTNEGKLKLFIEKNSAIETMMDELKLSFE